MNDHTKYWRIENYGSLAFLRAMYTTYAFPKHLHETYVIEIVQQGVDRFFCAGRTYCAPAGSIVLINPYEVHTGQSVGADPLIYRSLYPAPELLHDKLIEMDAPSFSPYFGCRVLHDPALYRNLLALHCAFEEREDALLCDTLFYAAFGNLLRKSTQPALPATPSPCGHTRQLLRVKSFLIENTSEKISLQQLSKIAGVSPFHLLRIFCSAFGLSPHAFLTNLRVERAKKHIAAHMPLAQVAHAAGFCDQSHLTRHFKRLTGMTPGQYAQTCGVTCAP